MVQLVPVDHDPFAPKGATLVPVDHDPFSLGGQKQALQSSFEQKKQGVVASHISNALNKISSNQTAINSGVLDPFVAGISDVGAVAGNAAGIINQGIAQPVVSTAADLANSITPQKVKDYTASNRASIVNSAPVQAIEKRAAPLAAAAKYELSKHPNVNALVGAAGDIANAAATFEGASLVAPALLKAGGTGVKAIGDVVSASGDASALKGKTDFVHSLITPKETPTVRNSQFTNAEEKGILRKRVVNPTPQEQSVIGTVSELPVSKRNSLLKNYTIISDANEAEAKNLKGMLEKNKTPIADDDVQNTFLGIKDDLAKSPFITGDGETAANRVINGALEHIANNDLTPAGILQARKDFDQWVTRLKGEKAFNPTVDSPATIAIQQVRQGMNGLIDKAVPDAGVRASLSKQSNLYRAMDNIETKGGDEAKHLISRLVKKATEGIPGKTLGAKAAVAGAATALGAGGIVAGLPVASAALTGGALYGAGKAITSPGLRQVTGKTLSKAGQLAKLQAEFLAKKR